MPGDIEAANGLTAMPLTTQPDYSTVFFDRTARLLNRILCDSDGDGHHYREVRDWLIETLVKNGQDVLIVGDEIASWEPCALPNASEGRILVG